MSKRCDYCGCKEESGYHERGCPARAWAPGPITPDANPDWLRKGLCQVIGIGEDADSTEVLKEVTKTILFEELVRKLLDIDPSHGNESALEELRRLKSSVGKITDMGVIKIEEPDRLRSELCQALGLPADTATSEVETRVKRLVLDILKANEETTKATLFEGRLKQALDIHDTRGTEDILEEVLRLKADHQDVVACNVLRHRIRSLLVLKNGASDREIWDILRARLKKHEDDVADFYKEKAKSDTFLWDIREAVGLSHHNTPAEALFEVQHLRKLFRELSAKLEWNPGHEDKLDRLEADLKAAKTFEEQLKEALGMRSVQSQADILFEAKLLQEKADKSQKAGPSPDYYLALCEALHLPNDTPPQEIVRQAARIHDEFKSAHRYFSYYDKCVKLEAELVTQRRQYSELAEGRNTVAQEAISLKQELSAARDRIKHLENRPPEDDRSGASLERDLPGGPTKWICHRCSCELPFSPVMETDVLHTREKCIEALKKEVETLRSTAGEAEVNRVPIGFSKGELGEIRANGLILIWGDGQLSDLGRAFPRIVEQSRQYYKPGREVPKEEP